MKRKKYYLVATRANGKEVWSNWDYYPHTQDDKDWFKEVYAPDGDVREVVED